MKPDAGSAGDGGPDSSAPSDLTGSFSLKAPKLDILFVVDDWASTVQAQQKFIAQLPIFAQVLQSLPGGLPDLHVAVVSADMGANTGSSSAGCTPTGDDGVFKSAPEGSCTSTTLTAGGTFIADDASGATKNFSQADPAGLASVLQCIMLLGGNGCGFPQPLAAAARALGADGQPAPAQNAGFLRDDAQLAIILLTNQDDCSVPAGSQLFSDSSTQIADPLGPLTTYRCSEFGYLCGGVAPPRMSPNPSDLSTTVDLTNCQSNENGMLTPVATLSAQIKSLKPNPDQILVAAIAAPTTPTTVQWAAAAAGADTQPWPAIEHACDGTDGSFGLPSVRTTQWLESFDNSTSASICSASYSSVMATLASKAGALGAPPCITSTVEQGAQGPMCTVVEHVTQGGKTSDVPVPSCIASDGAQPCWTLSSSACTSTVGVGFMIGTDPNYPNPDTQTFSYSCVGCPAGATTAGCQ